MSAAPTFELAAGVTIAGRFKLTRPLGHGGMGAVWAATHATLGTEVAIKFVDIAGEDKSDALRRFEREANIIARLRSPHVVQILDYAIDEAGRPYLAMELLHGEALKERLDRTKTMPRDEVVTLVVQACRALHRAHKAGVVHRDIKPANVFLCEEDDGVLVKLLDFGIAKVSPMGLAPGDAQRTETGVLVGTPAFMSPEQVLGADEIDGRSDLFSLAIVAWRALVGMNPHEREGKPLGLGELVVQIAMRPVPPPSQFVDGISLEMDAWFATALAKTPQERFQSAREMADALAKAANMPHLLRNVPDQSSPNSRALSGSGENAMYESTSGRRKMPTEASALPPGSTDTNSALRSAPSDRPTAAPVGPRRSHRASVIAGGIGLVALLALGAMFVGRGHEPPPLSAATSAPAAVPANVLAPAAEPPPALPSAMPVAPAAVPVPSAAPPVATAAPSAAPTAPRVHVAPTRPSAPTKAPSTNETAKKPPPKNVLLDDRL